MGRVNWTWRKRIARTYRLSRSFPKTTASLALGNPGKSPLRRVLRCQAEMAPLESSEHSGICTGCSLAILPKEISDGPCSRAPRFHAHRTAAVDCHPRRAHRPTLARRAKGARFRQPDAVRLQL